MLDIEAAIRFTPPSSSSTSSSSSSSSSVSMACGVRVLWDAAPYYTPSVPLTTSSARGGDHRGGSSSPAVASWRNRGVSLGAEAAVGSSRPGVDGFVDVLIELTWTSTGGGAWSVVSASLVVLQSVPVEQGSDGEYGGGGVAGQGVFGRAAARFGQWWSSADGGDDDSSHFARGSSAGGVGDGGGGDGGGGGGAAVVQQRFALPLDMLGGLGGLKSSSGDDEATLRVLVDRQIIEAFAGGGAVTHALHHPHTADRRRDRARMGWGGSSGVGGLGGSGERGGGGGGIRRGKGAGSAGGGRPRRPGVAAVGRATSQAAASSSPDVGTDGAEAARCEFATLDAWTMRPFAYDTSRCDRTGPRAFCL